jgi:hypothetical protein
MPFKKSLPVKTKMAAAAILVFGEYNCNLRTHELFITKFGMGMYSMILNTIPT